MLARRRLLSLVSQVCSQCVSQQVSGADLANVGSRMGSQLNEPGRRSDDPGAPSPDVGTVKLFENERIRVWDMCVEVGGNTGFHQHVHDYIFMQIGDGLCKTETFDLSTREFTIRDGLQIAAKSCTFIKVSKDKPSIHRLTNISPDSNYRQILVEFLEGVPRHSREEVTACLAHASLTTEVGSGLLFENDFCRVHDFSLEPHSGDDLPWHHHTLPYFFVNTCGEANSPGVGFHGLRGYGNRQQRKTFKLWSQDRDISFQDVPFGGYNERGAPVHQDKVWNDTDVPYCSFIVEIK